MEHAPRSGPERESPAGARGFARRHPALIVLLAVAVGLATFTALFDWDAFARGFLLRRLEARTGRHVDLDRVAIHPGFPARLEAWGLRIANPDWAREPLLLSVEHAEGTIRLLPLIVGSFELPAVTLTAPRLDLEQSGDRRSWAFDRQGTGSPVLPHVGELAVRDGRVTWFVPDEGLDVAVRIDEGKRSADVKPRSGNEPGADVRLSGGRAPRGEVRRGGEQRPSGEGKPGSEGSPSAGERTTATRQPSTERRLVFSATGSFKGQPVTIEGNGASLMALGRKDPYPASLDARIGNTRAVANGTIGELRGLDRIDADLELSGASLAALHDLIGVTFPETQPPFRLHGRLQRDGKLWRVAGLEGAIGKTDVAGTFSVDTGQQPTFVEADLHSRLLRFADLGPLVGIPARAVPGVAQTPAEKRELATRAAKPTVLPERPIAKGRWRGLGAHVKLVADRVERPEALPIDDFATTLDLRDGVLTLDPLRFGAAGGTVDGKVRLDATRDPLGGTLDAKIAGLKLGKLFPGLPENAKSTGLFYGEVKLAGSGTSVRGLLASANGSVYVSMTPGRVSNILLEEAGLDAGEIFKFLAIGDRTVPVQCAIANLDVKNGVMSTDALVIATSDTNVVGTGKIDLRSERMDLTFHLAPKDFSVLVARAPLHVRGTFKRPEVRPDAVVLGTRAVLAVLLGAVNPVLALAPLVETGPGRNVGCSELLAAARRERGRGTDEASILAGGNPAAGARRVPATSTGSTKAGAAGSETTASAAAASGTTASGTPAPGTATTGARAPVQREATRGSGRAPATPRADPRPSSADAPRADAASSGAARSARGRSGG